MKKHAGQLDYPPHDVRGPLDAATFRMTEQTMTHVLTSGGRLMMDCSEFATELCRWAGLADPNGLGYRYAGYTGTMLAHLPHYSDPGNANVGALCVFGPGSGEHVSVVYTPGADPVLASHGRNGFDFWRLSVERTWHAAPVTFLSIAAL